MCNPFIIGVIEDGEFKLFRIGGGDEDEKDW